MLSRFCVNSAFPTLLLWYERIAYNTDLRGYLEFAHDLARVGLLPPDTLKRTWTIWEETYQNARPGANFGYEAQAYVIFILPVIFLCWYLRKTAVTPGSRMLHTALLALSLSGLAISLSRTGMFTLGVCLFLGAKGGRKFLFLAVGAALVGALIALFPDNYFIARYTMRSTDAYPMAAKLMQIMISFQSVFSQPASLLLGNPLLVDKSVGGINPHNQFMYDMMTKGLVSLSLGLGLFWTWFRALRRPPPAGMPADPDLRKALWLCLMAFFINCLSTQAMINSNTAVMLWVTGFFLTHVVAEERAYRVRAG